LGIRRFPSRWLCLCFWIVAVDPCLSPVMFHKKPTPDSSHWSKAVSANKRVSTIIVPTKCTSLLKAQDITICTFCLCILSPYMFQPTWAIFRGRNASA
jgi:hypothetical protein